MDKNNREPKIQIEMRLDLIVIRTEAYKGVLAETKFEGRGCYRKFLQHMKSVYDMNNMVAVVTSMN